MATGGNHFAALIRQSRTGGARTLGTLAQFQVAATGLGQVPESAVAPAALPEAAKVVAGPVGQAVSPFAALAAKRAGQANISGQGSSTRSAVPHGVSLAEGDVPDGAEVRDGDLHQEGQVDESDRDVAASEADSAQSLPGPSGLMRNARLPELASDRLGGMASSPSASSASPFKRLSAASGKNHIHGVKVLHRLVGAICMSPGTEANEGEKSRVMTALLAQTHRAANAMAMHIAPMDAHRGWVKAAAQTAAVEMVASQFELAAAHGRSMADAFGRVERQMDLVLSAFDVSRDCVPAPIEGQHPGAHGAPGDVGSEVAHAIESLSEGHQYVNADSAEIARSRVEVSMRLAAWDLFESVKHPGIGMHAGESFSYSMPVQQLVAQMLPACLGIAVGGPLDTALMDLKVAHLQGSIRRVASLLGAEYVAYTKSHLARINAAAQMGESERDHAAEFSQQVLPLLVSRARENFLMIEQLAPKILDASFESSVNGVHNTIVAQHKEQST